MKKYILITLVALGFLAALFQGYISITSNQKASAFIKGRNIEGGEELTKDLDRSTLFAVLGGTFGFLLVASGLIISYIYLVSTERKQDELLTLTRFRDAIMEHSREIILTLDGEGIIATCNHVTETILGYDKEEIVNKPFIKIINIEQEKVNLESFSIKYGREFKCFKDLLTYARQKPISGDIIWTSKNNRNVNLQAYIAPLLDSEGHFSGFLLEAYDVTERVQWVEKLVEARDQAEKANRAKSQFLANMSHDLRTPLTAIIGYTDILKYYKKDQLNSKELTFLERIETNGQLLLTMIRDIMDIERIESRKDTVKFSVVRIENLVDQIFKELEIRADKKQIALILEGAEGLEPLQADEQKLSHILTNLITNAVKFTVKGSVRVVITQDKETHQATQIDVIDTGIGVDPSFYDQIFQPFFQVQRTAKKEDEGSGLGLSICKSLSIMMGYRLSFISTPGKGSTFILKID